MSARFMVLPKHFFSFSYHALGIFINIILLYGVFFFFPFSQILPEKWQWQYFWLAFLSGILLSVVVWFYVLSHTLSQRVLVGDDGIIFIKKYREYHVVFGDILEITVKKSWLFANIFTYGTLTFITKKGNFHFSHCPQPLQTAQSLLQIIQK